MPKYKNERIARLDVPEYKDIFDWAIESVNSALLASQLGNSLDSPTQFGTFYMDSIVNIIDNTNC